MSKVLLAAIDETNVSLSLAGPGSRPSFSVSEPCNDAGNLYDRIQSFIQKAGSPRIVAGAFCAPGPVRNDAIQLTNARMHIDRAALRGVIGSHRVHLVNDFLACALAVPRLNPAEVEKVGGGQGMEDMPIGVIGPWQGLGVSTLVPDSNGEWLPVPGEGGHILVAAHNDREAEVLSVMRRAVGRVAAEDLATEPGLVKLHTALAQMNGVAPREALEDILSAAGAGDPTALEAVKLFTGWVGDIAGNLALTVGARGGVYIFSRLMATHPELFDRPVLRAHFEDKGKMSGLMHEIPLYLVSTQDAALLGLSTLFHPDDARSR